MSSNKNVIKKLGLGTAILAAPIAVWVAASHGGSTMNTLKPPGAYTSSNYLKEKSYLDCKDKCSELRAGYDWAKANNVCDPNYYKGTSESYNIGVQAWAWDECAYSNNGKPI